MLTDMSINESPVSSNHLLELNCSELLVGMFITELDCSWSGTPFPVDGFHVKNPEDIQLVIKHCKSVTINTNLGASPKRAKRAELTILSSARRSAPSSKALKVDRDAYPVTHTVKQQLDKVYSEYVELQNKFQKVADAVREGNDLELENLDQSIAHMVGFILANPQTLIWILNTESAPLYRTSYCVRAAVWAAMLARQFGVPENEIRLLFSGTLLADIGLHLLPGRLVNKQGRFRKKEFLAYRKHVEFGLELLSQHPELDDRIVRIVRCHHERHDGLGFPRGIQGEQLASLSRFANLAFCFERLLYTNIAQRRVSPANAIARLYKQRELKFPEQFVVEFIQVMGMYPVGSVIELNTGELALVLEQNEHERLSPSVAVITDADKAILDKPELIDLASQQESNGIRSVSCSADIQNLQLPLDDYRFRFFGKKLGLGLLSIRI